MDVSSTVRAFDAHFAAALTESNEIENETGEFNKNSWVQSKMLLCLLLSIVQSSVMLQHYPSITFSAQFLLNKHKFWKKIQHRIQQLSCVSFPWIFRKSANEIKLEERRFKCDRHRWERRTLMW